MYPKKYKHLANKKLLAITTMPGWTRGKSYLSFAVLHKQFRKNPAGVEFYPIPGYKRDEENNVTVADLIKLLSSLELIEGEVYLGLKDSSSGLSDYVPAFFLNRVIQKISVNDLMPLVTGESKVIENEIDFYTQKLKIKIKRIEYSEPTLESAFSSAIQLFRYKVYSHLPVLILSSDGDGNAAPAGLASQLAIAYYMIQRGLVSAPLVECGILFDDFDLPIPVVKLEKRLVDDFLTSVKYKTLRRANATLAAWFESLTGGAEDVEEM